MNSQADTKSIGCGVKHVLGQDRTENQKKKRKTRSNCGSNLHVKHSLLTKFYPKILTLREYLTSKSSGLPRLRRKKIASYGSVVGPGSDNITVDLVRLLDTTLVCLTGQSENVQDRLAEKWAIRRQTVGYSLPPGSTDKANNEHCEVCRSLALNSFTMVRLVNDVHDP